MSTAARLSALSIALAALAALGLRVAVDMAAPDATLAGVVWAMARFFTVLTTLLVAVTFAAIAAAGRCPPVWTAILALAIGVVGVVYHLLLAGLQDFTGWGRISDLLFHTLVAAAVGLWWAVAAPKAALHWRQVPLFAAWRRSTLPMPLHGQPSTASTPTRSSTSPSAGSARSRRPARPCWPRSWRRPRRWSGGAGGRPVPATEARVPGRGR